MFALPAPGRQADKLDCPHCGAPVPPTNHRCAHCGTQLLVRACPRCFARVFHGARHCSHCGAETDLPAAATDNGEARARSCPRCDRPLVGQLVADVLLDQCDGCGGMFVDSTALERILAERRQARADALLGAPPPATATPASPGGRVYIRCPDCDTMMNRRSFARGAGVIVDVCRGHGTWFDAGELPKVVAFAMAGGLERAAAAEAENRLDQARRLDSERRSAQMLATPSDPLARSEYLASLLDALHRLFRWS